jgi:hypothetical protein
VLVGCEFTGIGRDAFLALGHDAVSCDLLSSEVPGPHHVGDIVDFLRASSSQSFDLIILHPECTAMALCGNGTYAPAGVMSQERRDAIDWTVALWELAREKGRRVCLENPGSVIFPILRKRGALVQYVQPWEFGHPETKKTGLALHGLEPLQGTDNVFEHMMTLPASERHKIWYASPSDARGQDRSRSFPGILGAMAAQWGQRDRSNPPRFVGGLHV